jgi:hypothetical protein
VHGPAIAHEDTVVIEVYDGPHYPERPSWYARRAQRAPTLALLRGHLRRRTGVVPINGADRVLAAGLPEGVGERADRARQHERPRQSGRKAELA